MNKCREIWDNGTKRNWSEMEEAIKKYANKRKLTKEKLIKLLKEFAKGKPWALDIYKNAEELAEFIILGDQLDERN